MHTDVIKWNKIRRSILTGGMSQREAARKNSMSRTTIRKMVTLRSPPVYRRATPARRPKLDSYAHIIDTILASDETLSKKCRHTAKRIHQRLRKEHGFEGSYSIIRDYVREARSRLASVRSSGEDTPRHDSPSEEDAAQTTYALVQSLPKDEAVRVLRKLFGGEQASARLNEGTLQKTLATFPRRETAVERRLKKTQSEFNWMRRVLPGAITVEDLSTDVGNLPDLQELHTAILESKLSIRNRALAVLSTKRGISGRTVQRFLNISRTTVLKYVNCYESGGFEALMARKKCAPKKSAQECYQKAVIALLHSPPSEYGINRTTWKMDDLCMILRQQGLHLWKDAIREILKNAGYRWRKARVVLTSNDPEYRTKVDAIKTLLAELQPDEAFFSIDEYGPFAVKMKPGRKRVGPDEVYTVPQWQNSKGWMILTAALELSENQVTHFYSKKKNTDEMIRLSDMLAERYHGYKTIYLSWDAASWHMSKKLEAHLRDRNDVAAVGGFPIIKTAPLPAGAQFLNVIESVFSGMAKAIIHNSDYPSVEAVQAAINQYYLDRNAHFVAHPRRAGKKLWGEELVPATFGEGQNCKDPEYR